MLCRQTKHTDDFEADKHMRFVHADNTIENRQNMIVTDDYTEKYSFMFMKFCWLELFSIKES